MLQGMIVTLKSVQQEPLLGINLLIFSPGITHVLVLDVLTQIEQLLCVHPEKRETNSPQRAEGKMGIVRVSTNFILVLILLPRSGLGV